MTQNIILTRPHNMASNITRIVISIEKSGVKIISNFKGLIPKSKDTPKATSADVMQGINPE